MNILYCIGDNAAEWNSATWRMEIPARAINRTGAHQARLVNLYTWAGGKEPHVVKDADWADVIVIQRNAFGIVMPAILRWKAQGKRVFLDLDDGYQVMPKAVPAYAFWHDRQAVDDSGKTFTLPFSPVEHLGYAAKLVDGITTPSEVIVNDWRRFGKAYFVPNYPETAAYTEAKRLEDHDGIWLGWGGGGSHLDSFTETGVLAALARIVANRENVTICIIGHQAIYDRVPVSPERKRFIPWGAYSQWPAKLKQLDIGITPLAGAYDKRRSWIKGLEFSLAGIPWVGTDYGGEPQPYDKFGKSHLVRNTPKCWEYALLDIVDCYFDYWEKAQAVKVWAKQFDIDKRIGEVLRVYEGKG